MSRVSIILPTRNSIEFLAPRVESIRRQTMSDYEVIVVDTDSTDGTLDYLKAWAKEDGRVSIRSAPPGVYRAFNCGIAQAKGEYVYIATSDDTMREDALEKMVKALDAHPDCDICDTKLREIDKDGRVLTRGDEAFLDCSGHLLFDRDRECVREYPLDFLMHCGGKTVYVSLAQILIRKTLFEKTGPFPEDYGPSADYKWGMLAALNAKVYYLPEELTTWRMREGQLTGHLSQQRNFTLMCAMAEEVYRGLADARLKKEAYRLRELVAFKTCLLPIKRGLPRGEKLMGILKAAVTHPVWFAEFVVRYLANMRDRDVVNAGIATYDYFYRKEVGVSLARLGQRISAAE